VERASGTRWIGGSVGPRAGLDDVEKRKFLTLPGLNSDPSVVQSAGAVQTEWQPVALKRVGLILFLPAEGSLQ
jgi:hypothetical protein